MKKYKKRANQVSVAIKLDLDTDGFTYTKWGAVQKCKKGDWIVSNRGDTYTVDDEVFIRTYKQASLGLYVKTTPVWAEIATKSGSVKTKEGRSNYLAGDYIVYNNEDGTDAYCMGAEKFEEMYEVDE